MQCGLPGKPLVLVMPTMQAGKVGSGWQAGAPTSSPYFNSPPLHTTPTINIALQSTFIHCNHLLYRPDFCQSLFCMFDNFHFVFARRSDMCLLGPDRRVLVGLWWMGELPSWPTYCSRAPIFIMLVGSDWSHDDTSSVKLFYPKYKGLS